MASPVTRKRAALIAAAAAFVGALIPTALLLAMVAANNNHGELFDTVIGQWNLGYALSFFAIFFIPLFLLIYAIARWWHEGAGTP